MRSRISEYSVSAAATQGRERGVQQRDALCGRSRRPAGWRRAARPARGAPAASVRRLAWHHSQQVAVDAVGGELVGGQIDPAAAQILVDVAQEVGELERLSERGGVRCGVVARADGAEHRQQLQPDHLGRAVHVALQRGAVRIVGHGQVHPHRRQEVVEQLPGDAVPVRGVHHRRAARDRRRSPRCWTSRLNSCVASRCKPFGALGGADGAASKSSRMSSARAGEPVERVHRRTLLGRQQPGGQEERPAVLGVERLGTVGRRPQGGIAHARGVQLGARSWSCPLPMCGSRCGRRDGRR